MNNIPNQNKRWLDLVWTNDCNNVSIESSKFNLLPKEVHHYALELNYEVEIDNSYIDNDTLPEWNFRKAKYPMLNNLINEVDWNSLLNVAVIDD